MITVIDFASINVVVVIFLFHPERRNDNVMNIGWRMLQELLREVTLALLTEPYVARSTDEERHAPVF